MNRTTGAERYNARMHKIFEDARRLKVDKAYPKLVAMLHECADFINDRADEMDEEEDHLVSSCRALLAELGEVK